MALHDTSYIDHMTVEQAQLLQVGDCIDHRDAVGRFVAAQIIEKNGSNLKIHYRGWSDKWDSQCSYETDLNRFAIYQSISKRPVHRLKHLKVGDLVDINPLRHPGWKHGEIRTFDRHSGQVQVVYEHSNTRYLFWIHLDNMKEIDVSGTHIEAPEKIDRLPIWLETRHELLNTSDQIKSECGHEIIETVFGGISNLIDFMVDNGKALQIQKIKKIIQDKKIKEEESKLLLLQNESESNIENECEPMVFDDKPKISTMNELSKDAISYICGYMNRKDIKSFKLTSYKNCIVCLKEMKKYQFGIFNTNELINDTTKKYIDLIGIGGDNLFIYTRFVSSTPYSYLSQQWQDIYNIPKQSQFLYSSYYSMNRTNVYIPPSDAIMRHLRAPTNYYLMDKRNTILFDPAPQRFGENGTFSKRYHLVVLKWFDIYFQQIITLQFMMIDPKMVTMTRFLQYMKDEFIVTTQFQQIWRQRFVSYLKEMNDYKSNESTIIIHQELRDLDDDIDKVEIKLIVDLSQNLSQSVSEDDHITVLIFQLDTNHPLFNKSKFTNIKEKYQLL